MNNLACFEHDRIKQVSIPFTGRAIISNSVNQNGIGSS